MYLSDGAKITYTEIVTIVYIPRRNDCVYAFNYAMFVISTA